MNNYGLVEVANGTVS